MSKKILLSEDSIYGQLMNSFLYRNAMFANHGKRHKMPKPKPAREPDKYDLERIEKARLRRERVKLKRLLTTPKAYHLDTV